MAEQLTPPRPTGEAPSQNSHQKLDEQLEAIMHDADTVRDASIDSFNEAAIKELNLAPIPVVQPDASHPAPPVAEAKDDVTAFAATPVNVPIDSPADELNEGNEQSEEPIIARPDISPPVQPEPPENSDGPPAGDGFPDRPKPLVVINDDQGKRIVEAVGIPHDIAPEAELSDEEINSRYGMTREEYDERLTVRERMLPGEVGWLKRERRQLETYLTYLDSQGPDLPGDVALTYDRMEARIQDLVFLLDNDRKYEEGLTGAFPNRMHHLPTPVTESMRSYVAPKDWRTKADDSATPPHEVTPTIPADETNPIPSDVPAPGEPAPGEPAPGEPAPGEPAPGEPAPGEPAPGEPAPGEPAPGEPAPGEHSLVEPLVAHIADTEVADRRKARILADHQVNTELAALREEIYGTDAPVGGNVFSRMAKSVARAVKGTALHPVKSLEYVARSTMLREGYRQKYIYEKFGQMRGSEFHSAVADEVARRLDLGTDLLMDGETILGEDRPEVRRVKDQLNAVFYQGLTGAMDRASVLEEARRIAENEASWINNSTDQGPHLIQNLETIYDRVMAQVDHEAGLAAVDEAYRLEGGSADLDVNAEAHRTRVDAVMEKLTNSRFKGCLVNEATTAVVVGAVASFVGNFLKSGSVRKGAVLLGVVSTGGFSIPVALAAGAAAGGFAALRERMTLRQERALHMAELASGSVMPDAEGAPRRAEIDATIVEMASAGDLIQRFDELQPEDGLALSTADAQQLSNWLVHTTTLQEVGDAKGLDLIRYSSPETIEEEKTDLFVARARAIAMMRDYAAANPAFLSAVPGATFDEKLANQVQMAEQTLVEGELSDRDKTFRSLVRKRGAQRAVATAAFSVFSSFISSRITDQIRGGHEASSVTHRSVEPNTRVGMSMRGDAVNIPRGWHADGKQLFDSNGKVVLDHFTGSGTGKGGLSPESIAAIRAKGYGFHEKVDWHHSTTVRQVSTTEYISHHPEQFKTIHRTAWMDNNTPAPRYDLNELRLDFHSRPDGSVVLASDRMFNTGSFHDQLAVMAHSQQSGGHLRMLITPSRADQTHAIVLDIKPNGEVVLPPGSPARSFFDIQPGGKVDFKGGFVEVGYPSSIQPDGSNGYFILATFPGTNHPGTIPLIQNVDYPVTTATITVPRITTDHIASTAWKAPFIPIAVPLPRKPLEELVPPPDSEPEPGYGYGYGEGGLEEARRWMRKREKMHREYREVPIVMPDGSVETKWIGPDGAEVVRDVARERETLSTYIEDISRATPGYRRYLERMLGEATLAEMGDECRVSVNIPAWMEGAGIYGLLSRYVNQTDRDGNPLDPRLFEINIIVNRKTGTEADNSVAEIERFKADMRAAGQNYNINFIDVEFDPPLNNVGHARKVISDLTVLRSLRRTGQSQSLYIETEDADLLTVDPHVITNVIAGFDQEAHLDVLRGDRNDRLPALLMENDALFASRRMWDFTERLLRRRRYQPPQNSGKWDYKWNRTYSNGWGTAYTAEAYAMIGGYDSRVALGEDMLIGERITMLRGNGSLPNLGVVGVVRNRTSSSPRRFINELLTGSGAYADVAAFEDEATNHRIRTMKLPELMDAISGVSRMSEPFTQQVMKSTVLGYWEIVRERTPNLTEARLVMDRTMVFMGFKKADYELRDDGSVEIYNYSNLANALEEYRNNPPARVMREFETIRPEIERGEL